jgi:hypothetical protein
MQRGEKMYEVDRVVAKASITAVFAVSASGIMCTHMLIYPFKIIPFEITQRVLDDWSTTVIHKSLKKLWEVNL